MIDKMKTFFNSEKSMLVINLLIFFSILSRNGGLILIAATAWIVYLACFIKKTSSKTMKIIYGILIAVALFIIGGNLYYML